MITFGKTEAKCDRCGKKEAARVVLVKGKAPLATLCAFCLGDAIAAFTGWKVGPMLRQWNSISAFWKAQPKKVKPKAVKSGK